MKNERDPYWGLTDSSNIILYDTNMDLPTPDRGHEIVKFSKWILLVCVFLRDPAKNIKNSLITITALKLDSYN